MNGSAVAVHVPLGPTTRAAWQGGWRDGLSYGALGLPLAFVALPLYVVLPSHYASQFGVPLAWLGALLLAARLFDAATDPWIGRCCDAWFAVSTRRVLVMAGLATVVLSLGFVGLFFPPVQGMAPLLAWCGAMLLLSYGSYSLLSIAHQSWGARLGGDAAQRAHIVAWREGFALAGVLLASVLPSLAGLGATSAVLAFTLALGLVGLSRAPEVPRSTHRAQAAGMRLALANRSFRQLLAIYLLNGIASAIPATLVLFFIRDRLQAPSFEPMLLGAYFAAAALSIPLWLRAVCHFGLVRSWLGGMLLAIAAFAWATTLGAGDVAGFAAVCVGSGIALGADLSLPGALLAGVIRRAGHDGRLEGVYFGWWNMATKLNLALAAGIALPLLGLFGYVPGSREPEALAALSWIYCVLPCALKLAAAALLFTRHTHGAEGFRE
jgi:glycoside/pentoside/hexuronide:cation symporter, GPH family